ncbi:MAG: carboxypeptidase regulatory-like domain-containing protein [Planctomycetaceae bacterium]|nr:carboxypeptidase regulatory-like domain-containing protein [Planctomycetaceae bacterium]
MAEIRMMCRLPQPVRPVAPLWILLELAVVCAQAQTTSIGSVADGIACEDSLPGVVSGTVVDSEGAGIAGAEVAVVVYPNYHENPIQNGKVIATSVTNPVGEYEIRIPLEYQKSRESGTVWARAEGHVAARSNLSMSVANLQADPAEQLTLEKTPGTVIRVVDANGEAVEGATLVPRRVRVPNGVGYRLPELWERQSSGVTGSDGSLVIPHMSPGALDELILIPPGGPGQLHFGRNFFLNVRPVDAEPHFEIALPEFGRLEGQLIAEPKVTLPEDLKLTVESIAPQPFGMRHTVEVTVAEDGRFEIERIGVGRISIPTFLPDDQPARACLDQRVVIQAGETATVELVIAEGVKVHGRVVKSDTQQGVSDFRMIVIYGPAVRFGRDYDWQSFEVETDDDGTFSCRLPPGPVNLRMNRVVNGYEVADSWLPRDQRGTWGQRFVVPDQTTFDLGVIEMVRTVPVRGRLVDKDNKPVEGWSIYGYPLVPGFTQFETMNSVPGVTTLHKGRFESRYPETYPPRYWKASERVWKTQYEFEDIEYAATVISHNPLVLQVDGKRPLNDDEEIPVAPLPE